MNEKANNHISEQNKLVSDHLYIVKFIIIRHINVNEHIVGLGFDDLYQTGCMALCHAAMTYNGSVQFKTYANIVVKNKLIDHCRSVVTKNKHSIPMSSCITDTGEHERNDAEQLFSEVDTNFEAIETAEAIEALSLAKDRYSGITLKGIEAIELKVKGYTGKDIADIYGVNPNIVGSWISRAASKLRKDPKFMVLFRGFFDPDDQH